QYRLRLVRLVDRLISLLENNPGFSSFTLDGQTVLLDDYLEIRPENRSVLERLIAGGRLHVGPWFTSPDLFLVSGESVIRNLQQGRAIAEQFGSTMKVGYVPDPFGHIAQLPQILKKSGLDSFIFMRGLSEEHKKQAGSIFNWVSPDGTEVMAVYLVGGYYNAGNLGYPEVYGRFDGMQPDNKLALEQISKSVALLEQYQKEGVFLLNNGFDHMPEQPELPDLINSVNARNNGLVLQHGTFNDFIKAIQNENATHSFISGDLTGNADHPILLSVYSTRVYLKQQNHHAQSLLERYVEPFTAWAESHIDYPQAGSFLQHAWKQLLLNHPHDDICGCSVDGVHEDNEYRYRQVRELGNTMMVEVLETMEKAGLQIPEGFPDSNYTDLFVFNPHPRPARHRVAARICFPAETDSAIEAPIGKHKSSDIISSQRPLVAYTPGGTRLPVTVTRFEPHVMRNNYLESTWGRCYTIELECDLPAAGYSIFRICETDQEFEKATNEDDIKVAHVKRELIAIRNRNLELQCPDTGIYSLTDRISGRTFSNFIRFEYQQDAGDTYSFSPVKGSGSAWADFHNCTAHPVHTNALRLDFSITVPAGLESTEQVTIPITCDLRLNAESGLEIRIEYHNTAENGRLRIVLPTGTSNSTAIADAHFRYAERSHSLLLTPESAPERYAAYPGELEYPTLHQNDFILFNGERADSGTVDSDTYVSWIANRGLHEFEILQDGDNTMAAITLHRAVGYLSVGNGRIRRPQAGPSVPTPGAQCKRDLHADLCFGISATVAEAANSARAFSHPAWCREMPWLPHLKRSGSLPLSHSILGLNNPAVELSALKRSSGSDGIVLRLYNPGEDAQNVTARLGWDAKTWCETDLTEIWQESAAINVESNTLAISLNPFEIKTVLIR
ncbi:MAG: glycosyl hydrolase-related protein, partial [Rhodothermaceae bacterium]|nr:glycosyl hydrolase-related protein [Rhodothermaceae bacterium]